MDRTTYGYLKIHYPKLAEIVKTYSNSWINNKMVVAESFVWDETPEGSRFWDLIDSGEFSLAKKEYPQFFNSLKDTLKQL